MTPQTFDFFVRFMQESSGLSLQKEKQYLLENRLTTVIRKNNIENFDVLADKVRANLKGPLAQEVVESMSVTETSFFRDKTPFDLFAQKMLPEIVSRRPAGQTIRIWSAAASSGQEAYTLAMMCKESAKLLAGRRVEIVATDISTAVLEKAKSGIYSQFEVQRGMPTGLLLRYFEQIGEMWTLTPEIKSMISFRHFNLMSSFSGLGQFDIIFCRNVLIYFDVDTKKAIFKRLHSVMAKDGFMVLGGAETTMGLADDFVADPSYRVLFRDKSFAVPVAAKSAASA